MLPIPHGRPDPSALDALAAALSGAAGRLDDVCSRLQADLAACPPWTGRGADQHRGATSRQVARLRAAAGSLREAAALAGRLARRCHEVLDHLGRVERALRASLSTLPDAVLRQLGPLGPGGLTTVVTTATGSVPVVLPAPGSTAWGVLAQTVRRHGVLL